MESMTRARNEIFRLACQLDPPKRLGRHRKMTTLETVIAICYMCRAGCPWSMLPCPGGTSYKTAYHRFNMWSKHRLFEEAFYNLSTAYRLRANFPLIADTTQVKNVYGADVLGGKNHADRARNSTKVSVLCDSKAVPIALTFLRGNRHDSQTLNHMLNEAVRKTGGNLGNHGELHADRGYDSELCRAVCAQHNLIPVIPRRRQPRTRDSIRIFVEIAIGRFDKFRRIIMRFDSLISSFKSFHYIAAACLIPR
jgi:transposase